MDDMTGEDWDVLNALRRGDLGPLRLLLLNEKRDIHAEIRQQLARLINGQHWMDEFKLELVQHRNKLESANWGTAFSAAVVNARTCEAVEALMAEGMLFKQAVHEVAKTGGAEGEPVSDNAIKNRLTEAGFRRRKASR